MNLDAATALRDTGLRVTRQRLAVIAALAEQPHSGADLVLDRVRREIGPISTQAVYDVLNTLTDRGLLRRIQPTGSSARYELRVGDNHHHLVCRRCGLVADIDCAKGEAPCLDAVGLEVTSPGFAVDEAEVTYWGYCAACADPNTRKP
ncbi:MAG TPA: Fur family transcriptional regulator [Nocardioidaceae bacterium]|nr:Fur family transcriptional regulator [Nocardioidaceae bacterium]